MFSFGLGARTLIYVNTNRTIKTIEEIYRNYPISSEMEQSVIYRIPQMEMFHNTLKVEKENMLIKKDDIDLIHIHDHIQDHQKRLNNLFNKC